jgi:Flp pilus assembly protein TadD
LEATVELDRLPPSAEVLSSKISATREQPGLDLIDLYMILQVDPNDSLIALELAKRLRAMNRLVESARILRNVVKIDYRFETLNALAQVEYQLDDLDLAFGHLQQAILIAPENANGLFEVFKTLGNIFVRNGDFDSAEDNYFKAHRLNPRSDILHVNLGSLAVQKQNWSDATEKFRAALEINLTNDKAWVGLALCHRMKGDWELSWGNLEASLEYNPLNEVALGLALDWSTYQGREFRALELIRKFLIEGGWNEKLSLAFVSLSYRRGETASAKLELERLLAVNPNNEEARELAGNFRSSR